MTTPAFSLDFTTAVLDPRVTFTRSGNTATRVNSSGLIEVVNADLPRFDFDPVTLACKGLHVEEQRTNLFQRSEEFDNAYWSKFNASITTNAIVTPSGTSTGNKLVENTTTGEHTVIRSIAYTSGTAYTLSCYVKEGGRDFVVLQFSAAFSGIGVATRAWFNISTGSVGTLANSPIASIVDAGDGWYRCSITKTAGATGASNTAITVCNADNSVSYTGDGFSGIYIWGAQNEAGGSITSYIPTTTTALTRNPDVATITGTNFSDFWQASKGGAQVLALPSTVSGIRPLVQYDDGTANNLIALRGNAANPELQIVDGGAPQVQLDAGTIVANTAYRLTGWWQTNDCKARQNSGATVSDYTATIPTVTQARIGSDGTNYLNGTIATINYYDAFFGRPIYTRRKNKVFPSLL
jgi:hypothetical protein